MKILIITLSGLLLSINAISYDFFKIDEQENAHTLMGKKSKMYDAYKQGKMCARKNALKPLTDEQREIIANLIAKSYTRVE